MPRKFALISWTFPPLRCGVADYTSRMALELSRTEEVVVLTSGPAGLEKDRPFDVLGGLSFPDPRSSRALPALLAQARPDVVVLQYDPFVFYRTYGVNPFLAAALRRARMALPRAKFAVVVHETFFKPKGLKSKLLLSALRRQLKGVLASADHAFVTVRAWEPQVRALCAAEVGVHYMPVYSNFDDAETAREPWRRERGIGKDTLLVGMFGRIRNKCHLEHVARSLNKLRAEGIAFTLIYAGIEAVAAQPIVEKFHGLNLGSLSREEVSPFLSALDVFLAPFDGGVTSRHGAFLAALHHGLPIVGLAGSDTDEVLLLNNGEAFLLSSEHATGDYEKDLLALAKDPELRARTGEAAARLYDSEYSGPVLIKRFRDYLGR